MDWLLDTFEPAFMQRALLAGLLAVLASSTVGTWIVLRGLSFLGDAIAHGVIPGMALAVLWGFGVGIGAAVSALVMVAGITVVGHRSRLPEDVSIGLLFVGMLSLGVVIISRSQSFTSDLQSLLFGDVLGVTGDDLVGQAVAAGVVVAGTVVGYRSLLALSFNRTKAASLGLAPGWTHALFLGLITVAVVASFRAVGTLLVFGLLVGPPATASLLVRRVPWMMAVAVVLGAVAVVSGLVVSYHYDTAGGATMAGMSIALFFVVLASRELLAATRTRSHAAV